MAWTRAAARHQETTPVVHDGIIYMFVPALACRQSTAQRRPDLEYQRDYRIRCGRNWARNKNIGIYEDMVYFAAPDGVLLALDAKTARSLGNQVDNGSRPRRMLVAIAR